MKIRLYIYNITLHISFRYCSDTTSMLGRGNVSWGYVTWGDKSIGRHKLLPFSRILTRLKHGVFRCKYIVYFFSGQVRRSNSKRVLQEIIYL